MTRQRSNRQVVLSEQNISLPPNTERRRLSRTYQILLFLIAASAGYLLIRSLSKFLNPKTLTDMAIDNLPGRNMLSASPLPSPINISASSYLDRSELNDLLSKAKISYSNNFRDRISHDSWKKLIPLLQKQVNKIRDLLPETLELGVLMPLLQDKEFSIEVNSDMLLRGMDRNSPEVPHGMYAPGLRKIFILQDPDLPPELLKQVMRNEFYHAYIHLVNLHKFQKLPTNILDQTMPFMNIDGTIDRNAASRLEDATNKGLKRLHEFKKLLAQSSPMASNKLLERYMSAIKDYQPSIFQLQLPPHRDIRADYLIKRDDGTYIIGDNTGFAFKLVEYKDHLSLFYTFAESESPKHKASAFVMSVLEGMYNIDNNYEGHSYTKLTEKASSLYELPKSVLQVFFPEWLAYHDNYCSTLGATNSKQKSNLR
jgi:hypothetical protein